MRVERIQFFSDGLRLVGDLYLPDTKGPFPTLVRCPGWGAQRGTRLAEHFPLIDQGFALLAFDVRGYGDSAGDGSRLHPQEITSDVRAAVSFARQHPEVDPARIGILGVLTGAAAGLQAMSEDEHVAAAICMFPFGDGARWMRAVRRPFDWDQFSARIDAARMRRAVTGDRELVDPNEILIRDRDSLAHEAQLRATSEARRRWRLGLDSADAILAFRPEAHVDQLAGRHVLLIAVERDAMMPIAEVHALYARLPGPKRLLVFPDITHYQIYEPDQVAKINGEIVTFLNAAFAAAQKPNSEGALR